MNMCPYCGSPNEVGHHFCQYCGASLNGGVPQQQPVWTSMQQPVWALPVLRSQSVKARLLLMVVLLVLLSGIGGIICWQFGSKSSTANTSTGQLVISNVVVKYRTQTSAQIIWTTSTPASGQIEYGRNPTYGLLEPAQPQDDPTTGASMGVIDHSVTLTGLRPGTLYYYKVKSKDAAGNGVVSPGKNFKTVPTIIQIRGLQPA